ncbi:hypothetical protein JTE90_023532 [Oedothorax gibbosus]|uniref:Uncharacterized protein n=1 Tax=Oedothorax gibbosus TaxID=931172 RepID=A0AAV6UL69_9ARAC|nr:hypothetical protein JTE90_023532 [Oedothorax gibbosus]
MVEQKSPSVPTAAAPTLPATDSAPQDLNQKTPLKDLLDSILLPLHPHQHLAWRTSHNLLLSHHPHPSGIQ